jgi:hypothetical protein
MLLFFRNRRKTDFYEFLCIFNRRKNEKGAPVGIEHHRYNSLFKNQQVVQIVIYQRQVQEVIIATDSNGGEKLL